MKVIDQNIPSELFHDYQTSLRSMAQWQNNLFGTFKFGHRYFGTGSDLYLAQKRNPFRIPHMQGMGGNCPSAAQILIRQAFKRCVDCFNIQPYSGGATPPDTGSRNRSWWYSQAGATGLWYFDYFIQQTWLKTYNHEAIDWCMFGWDDCDTCWELYPDDNDRAQGMIIGWSKTYNPDEYWEWRTFARFIGEGTPSLLILYSGVSEPYHGPTTIIDQVENDWNPGMITYNNQPAAVKLNVGIVNLHSNGWHSVTLTGIQTFPDHKISLRLRPINPGDLKETKTFPGDHGAYPMRLQY